ncbi:ABC transporter ATP-binding protein [Mycoplasmatota bacterium]|nr:ABC transporter ATP-binding protein [Mycoplasmatota bacterium]
MAEFLKEQDYNDSFEFETWKKILRYLLPQRKLLIISIIIAIGIAFVETLLPLLNRYAIDTFLSGDFVKTESYKIIIFAVIYVLLVFVFAALIRLFIIYAGKIETSTAAQLREKAFRKLQKLPFSYYDKTPTGWIMARMTSDSRKLSNILAWGLIDVVWSFMLMIIIAIVLFIVNVKLALITLSVVPLLVLVAIYFRKKILIQWRDVRKTNSKITAGFSESIMGATTTKTLVLEDKHLEDFGSITSRMKRSSVRAVTISSLLWPTVLFLGYVGTSLSTFFGGMMVYNTFITVGTLFMFIQYSMQFFEPILNLTNILSEFQQGQAAAERIISLIDSPLDLSDSPEVIEKYGDLFDKKIENWEDLDGNIEFKDVSFKYKDGEKILDRFNLKIDAGMSVALVGETGSGKSTIVNLISRFYEPTGGQILIDGKNYKRRSIAWLHSNLGYVLQSPHLFTGTIKDNIAYGKLDATFEEIVSAAKTVNADRFISKTPNGYNSEVGEGGNKLSVGEKQLLSFARAVIADPKILILDEATSSIDTETEKLIQGAIDTLLKGRTSFIIAHRLSTIVNADLILVLKNGVITERGNHKELLEQKGYYHRLYLNQFKEKKTKEVL